MFEMLNKKFGPIFKELLNVLLKKLSLSSQKYGFGIRDPGKTYSGSRIQGSKRRRIVYFILFYFLFDLQVYFYDGDLLGSGSGSKTLL